MNPCGPRLLASDAPAVAIAHRAGLHVGSVRAVSRLRDAEGETDLAIEQGLQPLLLLRLGAVGDHEQGADCVADNRMLGLQIVVQAQAFGGEMLADDGHGEIRPALASELLGEGVAVVTGVVGETFGLGQELLPLLVG